MKIHLPSLNKAMFIFKFHYFFFHGGIAPGQTTMPVYAQTLGFSSSVVGTVYTILPLSGLLIKPLAGGIADRFKAHKLVMLVCVGITMLGYFCIQFIPSGLPAGEESLPDSVSYGQYQFYVFVLLMTAGFGGAAVTTTLQDTLSIAKAPDPDSYGRQRLWASMGYGILSTVSGLIIDGVSEPGQPKNYLPAFYLTLGMLLLDIIASYFYINVEIPERSENIGKDVWRTILKVRVCMFILWCIAMGVSMGLTFTFLYWLLEDLAKNVGVVGSIKTIVGLTNGVQTFIGEMPAFFFAGWVIKKLGHGHTVSLVFATIGCRFLCYYFLTNPWYGLFIEPLQLYYALFYSAMTSYANKIAPPGTQATIQSIMCAACEGIGFAIGGFVGGYLYDQYGGHMCFFILSMSFFVLAIANEVIEGLYRFQDRIKPELI